MIIQVDRNDNVVGTISKDTAHEKGILHRALSIFIVNSKGELLLQRRSENKPHSKELWSNTCCDHPLPGENIFQAARKCLKKELGLETELEYLFKFHYKADFNNVVTENEIVHVFWGETDEVPSIDENEISEYKYMSIPDVHADIEQKPEQYTVWFKLLIDHFFPLEM